MYSSGFSSWGYANRYGCMGSKSENKSGNKSRTLTGHDWMKPEVSNSIRSLSLILEIDSFRKQMFVTIRMRWNTFECEYLFTVLLSEFRLPEKTFHGSLIRSKSLQYYTCFLLLTWAVKREGASQQWWKCASLFYMKSYHNIISLQNIFLSFFRRVECCLQIQVHLKWDKCGMKKEATLDPNQAINLLIS